MSEVQPLEDGLPLPQEENFLDPEDPHEDDQDVGIHFPSIRRKPKLRLGHLKERLKAFGSERLASASASSKSKKKKRKSIKQEVI